MFKLSQRDYVENNIKILQIEEGFINLSKTILKAMQEGFEFWLIVHKSREIASIGRIDDYEDYDGDVSFLKIYDNIKDISLMIKDALISKNINNYRIAITIGVNAEHTNGGMLENFVTDGFDFEKYEELSNIDVSKWDEELARISGKDNWYKIATLEDLQNNFAEFTHVPKFSQLDNWYKLSQEKDNEDNDDYENFIESLNFEDEKYKNISVPTIDLLKSEARKYLTFDEFEMAFIGQLKHGLYWHVTDNPNFQIDPQMGPKDMSSMSTTNAPDIGKLMITSHLENWASGYYKWRKYAALIDMSDVSQKDYYQVNRGFGNELFVKDPSQAKVIAVYPLDVALYIDKSYDAQKPQNAEELKKIYIEAHSGA